MVKRIANRLNITGYVKNLEDGQVEIECEGDEERIDELVRIIKESKDPIYVNDVKISRTSAEGKFSTFSIITGDLASEVFEGFATGAMYMELIASKQDQTIKEIRTLSSSIHDMLDARFKKLEDDVSYIKAKIGV